MHIQKPIFIAEIGVNHDGSIAKAKKLVDAAKEAGASIVKFQTFVAERVVTKSASMAEYQKKNLNADNSQYEMLKKLELSYEEFSELKRYCDQKEIEFLSTGFDLESLKFLASLNPTFWKIPSGEITNLPYIEFMARQKGTIFLSTGMATMEEVEEAYDLLVSVRKSREEIYVMHCTTQYPAELKDLNLNVLKEFSKKFDQNIGYSDHSQGIEISLAAVAMGSLVIEKHITLDINDEGPDHKASITPSEFASMVTLGKNIHSALGHSLKGPTPIEVENKKVARRSIVANGSIKKGDTFTLENLDVKRPGTGINPMLWYSVIGKVASRDYTQDDLIDEKL
jgi:N,N'-diacetyllegionaminate synthase